LTFIYLFYKCVTSRRCQLLILYNGGVFIYRGEEKYFVCILVLHELLVSEVKKNSFVFS